MCDSQHRYSYETQRGLAYSLSRSHGAPDAIDKDAHRPELRRQPLYVAATTTTARAASLAALPLPCAQPLSLVYFPKAAIGSFWYHTFLLATR